MGLLAELRAHARPGEVVHKHYPGSGEVLGVSKPVGIALKYAGVLDEPALLSFLEEHGSRLQRPALRYAVEKLAPGVRSTYLR